MTTTLPTENAAPRKRGRPRDPTIDGRVLAATRQVVAEVGVRGASMSLVADRAGVGKPTIYLRWPNLRALVAAAVDGVIEDADPVTLAVAERAVEVVGELERSPDGRFLIEAFVLPSALRHLADRRGM